MTVSQKIDNFTAVFEKAFIKTLGKHPYLPEEGSINSIDQNSTKSISSEPQLDGNTDGNPDGNPDGNGNGNVNAQEKKYFGFFRSPRFWLAVVIGQILSLCLTCTNSLTTELGNANASMPLFQNQLNYTLLALIYNPFMWYRYGFKKWLNLLIRDSWRFFILAFADVEGNYFVVLAYEYTNMLSAALLDNFAIVVVVILSFLFLHVRYHWSQYIGILVTIGGMALLIVSDRLTGKDYSAADPVKGDLFVLLGAACYGISNTFEEFLVSERPLYEVLGMLGFWASCINAVQMGIFGRSDLQNATWNGKVAGLLIGYTFTMFLLYHLAPLMFRLSSAAFYNLNMLTSDFWALLVGTAAFGYSVYWLYPVGFVFTILGIIGYCAAPMTKLGEAVKPWLGENQQKGIDGIGTANYQFRARLNERFNFRRKGNDDEENGIEVMPSNYSNDSSHNVPLEQPIDRKSPAVKSSNVGSI